MIRDYIFGHPDAPWLRIIAQTFRRATDVIRQPHCPNDAKRNDTLPAVPRTGLGASVAESLVFVFEALARFREVYLLWHQAGAVSLRLSPKEMSRAPCASAGPERGDFSKYFHEAWIKAT